MSYTTLVINAKEDDIVDPFIHDKTQEIDGIYLNLRPIFKDCVQRILFGKTVIKKVLNLEIEKHISDVEVTSDELRILIDLYLGKYENGDRPKQELVELMMDFWARSEIFRNKSSIILEDLELNVDIENKYKIIKRFENDFPVGNLREYYRYVINENFRPIECTILNHYHKYCDRVHKTNVPLKYYITDCKPLAVQVMFGSGLYIPKIEKVAKEVYNACSV